MASKTCAKCHRPAEFAQGYTVANHLFHLECMRCSVCDRALTQSPYLPPGAQVKATVEGEPELFCTDCAGPEMTARGLVYSPHHTLAGPPGFGTMVSTTTATATFSKPTLTNTQHSAQAVSAGAGTLNPRQCSACGSPKWVTYGPERSRCLDCGEIF